MLCKCYAIFLLLNVLKLCDLSMINTKNERHRRNIIKNISFANEALQELIDNYKRLQKVYKSDESLQSDATSENNGKIRILLYDKQNLKQRNRSYSKPANLSASSTLRPGTVGIYESQSFESDSDDIKDIHQPMNKATPNLIDTKNINNDNFNDGNNGDSIEKDSSEYDSESDAISIEMPSKNAIGKQNKIIKSNRPKVIQNVLGEKTRFSIQKFDHLNKTKNTLLNIFKSPFETKNNRRRIKKIVYSERFSPDKIWQEVISKPINLTEDTDPYGKANNETQIEDSNDEKITIVIVTKNMIDSKKELGNVEDNIVLRSSYGETCLQVPIKKCDKVIKEVSTKTCKRLKCESNLKKDFLINGKNGCKKQFSLKKIYKNTTEKNEKIQPLVSSKFNYTDFIFSRDLIKNKYIKKNKVDPNIIILRNDTPGLNQKPKYLRDKYEAKCQEELREKCIEVCETAVKKTCSELSCKDKLKKAFQSSCKEECKKTFFVKNKSRNSSSTSSDSSDSDTGSS